MLYDVERTAVKAKEDGEPLPGLLRLKLDDCKAVPTVGISIDEARHARSRALEFASQEPRLNQLSTSRIQILVMLEKFDLFDLSQIQPTEDVTARILATTPENLKQVKKSVTQLEQMQERLLHCSSDEEAVEIHQKIHRKRGHLFGYPQCDIDFYAEGLKDKLLHGSERPEKTIVDEFIENNWRDILEQFDNQIFPDGLASMPTSSFYPHHACCEAATKQSKQLISMLSEPAKTLYRKELVYNHLEAISGQLSQREERKSRWEFFRDISSIPVADTDFRTIVERFQRSPENDFNILTSYLDD